MPRISNSEVVYHELVEESEENWLSGLVAFAIIEEQRIEWMRHIEKYESRIPSIDDIRHWYEQLPDGALLRAKGDAENTLTVYADEVLQAVLETERREVADGVIVNEIRLARRFLPQYGITVAGGVTSAIIFALVLVGLAFFVLFESSPINLGKDLFDYPAKETMNGTTESESRSHQ